MTKINPTVARAERRARLFADAARRNPSNVVTELVTEDRLIPSSPLTRTYRVEVIDELGRHTDASWLVQLETPTYGRRSVRFFGWAYSPYGSAGRIDEGLAYVRVS